MLPKIPSTQYSGNLFSDQMKWSAAGCSPHECWWLLVGSHMVTVKSVWILVCSCVFVTGSTAIVMAAVSLLRQGESEYLFFFILGDGGVVVAIYFQTDLFISCKKKKQTKKHGFCQGLFAVVKSMKPQRLPISKTVTSMFLFFKIPQVNNALFSPLSWLCTALVVINNVGRVLPETVMF